MIRQLIGKRDVIHQWVGLGRVQSFMLILGRVGLGHVICGSGLVGSRKSDQPTSNSAFAAKRQGSYNEHRCKNDCTMRGPSRCIQHRQDHVY